MVISYPALGPLWHSSGSLDHRMVADREPTMGFTSKLPSDASGELQGPVNDDNSIQNILVIKKRKENILSAVVWTEIMAG